jgi:hypothetical protein
LTEIQSLAQSSDAMQPGDDRLCISLNPRRELMDTRVQEVSVQSDGKLKLRNAAGRVVKVVDIGGGSSAVDSWIGLRPAADAVGDGSPIAWQTPIAGGAGADLSLDVDPTYVRCAIEGLYSFKAWLAWDQTADADGQVNVSLDPDWDGIIPPECDVSQPVVSMLVRPTAWAGIAGRRTFGVPFAIPDIWVPAGARFQLLVNVHLAAGAVDNFDANTAFIGRLVAAAA